MLWRCCVSLCLLLLISVAPALAAPSSSVFTYQGRLDDAGSPLDGDADFQVGLWNAATGGGQIGSTVTVLAVPVVDGLFTLELDFGATAFNDGERWLEFSVRSPAGSGGYTPLSPRQPVRATPLALCALSPDGHSLDGEGGGVTDALFVDGSGQVGVGTTTPGGALEVVGEVIADRVVYAGPRTHVHAISGAAFKPYSSAFSHVSRVSDGATYLGAFNNAPMLAPLTLPDGARITTLTAHFIDNSIHDLRVNLAPNSYGGGSANAGEVTSVGVVGLGSASSSSIFFQPVNYATASWLIHVRPNGAGTWDSTNLMIHSVVVEYTLGEAP